MGTEHDTNADTPTEVDQREYPFGLSSWQLVVLVVLVGFIGPGFLVYALEEVNLPVVADIVWLVGYGTSVLVVWFVWIRPLDLVGSSGQDTSPTKEPDKPETGTNRRDDESAVSAPVESPAKDSTSINGETSQVSTQENPKTSDSK